MRRLLALVVAFALAGCAQEDEPAAPPMPTAPEEPQVLHGLVLDEAVRPVVGATVSVLRTNATVPSAQDGSFLFPDVLARETPLVVMATSPGFQASSVQASLPAAGGARVRIVMPALPTDPGYRDVLKFDGVIGCQASVAVSEEPARDVDCGGDLDPGTTAWTFSADPKLLTAVVEVAWTPGQPLAEGLGATLVHVHAGNETLLAEDVGRSPLRLVVPQQTSLQRFAAGGEMRLDVYARPITDEDEQALAATVAFQQPFQAFASLFYGTPPDPLYSMVEGA